MNEYEEEQMARQKRHRDYVGISWIGAFMMLFSLILPIIIWCNGGGFFSGLEWCLGLMLAGLFVYGAGGAGTGFNKP